MRRVSEESAQGATFRLNIGEYVRLFWRRKYFVLVPAVAALAVAGVGVRFLVPIYEAGTVIRVESRAAVSREMERFVPTEGRRRTRDAETKLRIEAELTGSAFLDELIVRLGLDRDPRLLAAAEARRASVPGVSARELLLRRLRGYLRKRIAVDRVGPSLFRVSVWDADPEACYVIARTVTDLYIELQKRARMEGLQEVSDFSEEQLAVYKERLERSERALEQFQREMARRSARANPVNAGNIGAAETLLKELDVDRRNTADTIDKIRRRLMEFLGRVPNGSEVLDEAETRRLRTTLARRRETELLRRLTGGAGSAPETHSVDETRQALQRHINELVRQRFSDVEAVYRPLIAEYFYQQVELAATDQERAALDAYIRSFREQVALQPQMEAELARLKQEVEANRTLYNTFQSSRTSTQISEAVQSTELGETIRVVEAAVRPLAPVRPNKVKILALALVMGLVIGGGALLLTEFSDSSFRSVEEVERELGLRVLGTVPRLENAPRWAPEGARRRAAVWVAVVVLLAGAAVAGFWFYGRSSHNAMIDIDVTHARSNGGGGR